MDEPKKNIEPELDLPEEEDEQTLPETQEDLWTVDFVDVAGSPQHVPGSLGAGRAVIARHAKHAPTSPGVYRMIGAAGEVLYVGKAKSLKKRVLAYARPTGHDSRIARMIAATTALEFVSTATETEALLLEANLIKRLRPRFNVLLRDDKSFPYILITADAAAPQILKHRGARNRKGDYYGPFAAVNAVNRTITALERAFLIRSCSDAVFESRTRPCLLHQIKRCSAPCTGEIAQGDYAELVREAKAFLSGRSRAVKEELAREMETASAALDFERAAVLRDRLAALAAVQAHQGINPRGVEEADVFAVHQDGGYTCVEVFFFRTGQNWGNRAYFPKADRTLGAGEVLGAFLAQFYDDKPCPRCIFISHEMPDRALLAEALSIKSARKVEVSLPQRGEKKDLVDHAMANAREALGRKLADTASQQRLLAGAGERVRSCPAAAADRGLRQQPYPGHERGRRDDRRRPRGLAQEPVPQVQHPVGRSRARRRLRHDARSARRRFKRLIAEMPRLAGPAEPAAPRGFAEREGATPAPVDARPQPDAQVDAPSDEPADEPWPDLVLIDGGEGQLAAARDTLAALGVVDLPLVAIAKGPDRDAGRETFHAPGKPSLQAAAARSGAVFRPAAARRGAPLRDRLAPGAAQARHPRGRPAGDPRHRPDPQARAAAPFRHPQGRSSAPPSRTSRRCPASTRRPRAASTISSTTRRGDVGGIFRESPPRT